MAMAVYKKSLCLENMWSLRCINKRPGTIHSAAESFFWGRRYNSSFFFPTLSWSLSLRVLMKVVNPDSCFWRKKKKKKEKHGSFFKKNPQSKLCIRTTFSLCMEIGRKGPVIAAALPHHAVLCSSAALLKREGKSNQHRFHIPAFFMRNCEEMGVQGPKTQMTR